MANLRERANRHGLRALAAFWLIGLGVAGLRSESLTLTTAYPSPSGIYAQIITTGGGAAPRHTVLVRDQGNVGIGTTDPQAVLDIARDGAAIIVPRKSTAGDPAGVNGMLYYNGNAKRFRVFEDGQWKNLTGGNVVAGAYAGTAVDSTTPPLAVNLGFRPKALLVTSSTADGDRYMWVRTDTYPGAWSNSSIESANGQTSIQFNATGFEVRKGGGGAPEHHPNRAGAQFHYVAFP